MRKFETYQDVVSEFDWLPLALHLNPEDAILRLVRLIYTVKAVEQMDALEIARIFGEWEGHA